MNEYYSEAIGYAAGLINRTNKLQEDVRAFSSQLDKLTGGDPQISSELRKAFTLMEYASHELMGCHYDLKRKANASEREENEQG